MFYTITSIQTISSTLHKKGKKLVLATGFFDCLHSEHRKFLKKAKYAGDFLFIGVESDVRARALKGEGRPIESQQVRCSHLLPYADYIIALPDNFDNFVAYDSLMSAIRPNIYAVSSHTQHQKNKRTLTEKYGGQLIVVHKFNPEISTTKLIMQNKYN